MNPRVRSNLLANAAFVAALYLGLRYDVKPLTYAAIGVVWLLLLSYGAVFFSKDREPRTRPLPAAVDWTIDLAVLVLLTWYGWRVSAIAYILSVILLELNYRTKAGYGQSLVSFALFAVMTNLVPFALVLLAFATAWILWSLVPAAIGLSLFILWYAVAMYNGPRMAARNAVYAALTCRRLDFGELGAVDAGVVNICRRMGVDPERLGPAFPMSRPLVTDIDRKLFNNPANVFSLRALAMHERGIPPFGTKVAKWYLVKNPFWAAAAPRSMHHYRRKVLADYGIDLIELDPESYVERSQSEDGTHA